MPAAGTLTQVERDVSGAIEIMGRPVSEAWLQKVIHTLELTEEGFGFRFEETRDGPYCQKLHETIYSLLEKGYAKKDPVTQKIYYCGWSFAEA